MLRRLLLLTLLVGGMVQAAEVMDSNARAAEDERLQRLLGEEFTRLWASLQGQPEHPYWMSVDVVDRHTLSVQATHGAAAVPSVEQVRLADLDLRVGSPTLDNTHKIRDASWFMEDERPQLDLPLLSQPDRAFRLSLWRTADDAYRAAARRLVQVRNNEAVKVAREDPSPDFSSAPVVTDQRPFVGHTVDARPWVDIIREASAIFLQYPDVYDSNVGLQAVDERNSFLSTDGTRLAWSSARVRLAAWGSTVAPDGMRLEVYDYIEVADPARLPDAEALNAMVKGVAAQVTALRRAPVVEPYVGPAILSGRAAAVFFHEILGHRLEGHRQKDEDEGQTLTDKVGQAIFPSFISVTDDPTRAQYNGEDLSGYYPYDDEGVAAQAVVAVQNGVLRNFLMSRSPIAGFEHSNGHGRRQPGNAVVARQGNLLVESSVTVPYAELRLKLIEMVKKQGKPFGLIFDDISGGFTFTGRSTPNSFAVSPVVVWRVYADGRPDELVRGVDLIGTPLVAFSRIVAASDRSQVFNGVCGAESGWVPVSAVAPDLLLQEVEVQRKEKENDRPPLLSPPGVGSPS